MITKTLTFDDDVLETIAAMEWEETPAGVIGRIVEQLDRNMYQRVSKALDAMSGKWNRSLKGHLFKEDPRPMLPGFLEEGALVIEKDGFFETPAAVVAQMCDLYPFSAIETPILEPSAGEGAIIRHLMNLKPHTLSFNDFFVVEQNENRRSILAAMGVYVVGSDFMQYTPPNQLFPTIFMNPPFEQGQDVDHVVHAFDNCLAPGGTLISVMAAGIKFRSERKYVALRQLIEQCGEIVDLPENSFKESGTGVNTCLIILEK